MFDRHCAAADRDGLDRESTGMAVFEEVIAKTKARVRSQVDESWLNRGTLHAMADADREEIGLAGMRIGWHPDFEEKLTALLVGAVP